MQLLGSWANIIWRWLFGLDPKWSYPLCSRGFALKLESCYEHSANLKFLFSFAVQGQRNDPFANHHKMHRITVWLLSIARPPAAEGRGHARHWCLRISSTRLLTPLFLAKFLVLYCPSCEVGRQRGWVKPGFGLSHCHLLLSSTMSFLKGLAVLFPLPLLLQFTLIRCLPHGSTESALGKVNNALHVAKSCNIRILLTSRAFRSAGCLKQSSCQPRPSWLPSASFHTSHTSPLSFAGFSSDT